DDDDEEKLITIGPANLFCHAYPDIVSRFETSLSKTKKIKTLNNDDKLIHKTKKSKPSSSSSATVNAMSTSMSLDLLSMLHNDTYEMPIKKTKFNHRPTMAALST
ncbi:unnamed protein product, partial [Adineta steineri]